MHSQSSNLPHILVNYAEPHVGRTRQILAAHPEVKKLFGNTPSTSLYIAGVVGIQVLMTYLVRDSAWWVILLTSFGIGAYANHALWTLIHDCTHNLAFKKSWSNMSLAIFANLPIVFPSAISFRIYHIQHHIYQGNMDRDADLARPWEARLVGTNTVLKTLWFLFFFVSQSLRVFAMKGISFFNGWVIANYLVEIGFLAAITHFWGWGSLAYLGLASVFSVGLHPVGGRWIQEHYVVHEKQETYSYYGPLNILAFNVGFHNEHHDLMRVPWSRLPQVRAMAPEFYNNLYFHTSWTKLLLRFLTDPTLGPASRIIRPGSKVMAEREKAAAAPASTVEMAEMTGAPA